MRPAATTSGMANNTIFEQMLTRESAAEWLAVSLRTLDLHIANGDLQVCRIGRSVRIRPVTLERFVEAREGSQSVSKRKGKGIR